ncbi:uncharacterized protein LOC131530479 isoform X2 [Onychostoma macrolepis]|uniref:uncharacterized protein LOC131530479 isoform X2 n=1 Tax=Onychostoma macrolepis TaxID=369639 RepID=UPI00272A3901|nr:uncharacterized protein LOC131530479 isoform X2 [Onychostoma macrolepis]
MRSEFIVCLGMFLTHRVFGVEAVEEVRKVEGESATLHSGVEEYQRIIWLFGPQKKKITQCWGNASGNPWCETDQRLTDRLKTDDPTGSLTINNITNEDAGHYHLQILNNLPDKEFSVIVSAALPVPMIVKDSEKSSSSQCVLLCSVMNVTEATLCWYKGNSLISSVSVSDLNNSFSRPLEVNYQDFNNYSCVLNNSISSQTTHLNITELCQLCPEPCSDRGYIAQIWVPVVLVVLGGVTAWICWKKDKQIKMGSFRVMRGTEEQSPGDERSPFEIDEGS